MLIISEAAIDRRNYWVSEIVKLSGDFGQDSTRVERELVDEIATAGITGVLDHLRLCGAIPESYGHDTSEEKLYSKYTDTVLAIAFRAIGLRSIVLTDRADAADVEVFAPDYSFIADAKAFRLSRTAKNQKDFKIQAMDTWKRGKRYAVVVAPLYQLPTRTSQIYEQAITRDVCVLSYSHLAILLGLAERSQEGVALRVLSDAFESVSLMNPNKDAVSYWSSINRVFVGGGDAARDLWATEKVANLEAISHAKSEALNYLSLERERIMRMSHEQALQELIKWRKLDARARIINSVGDTGILAQGV